MNVTIPAVARKAVYALAFVAGAIALVVGVAFPDIATQVTDRLTTVGGIVSALAGVLAYVHLTPDADKGAAAVPQDDFTDDAETGA